MLAKLIAELRRRGVTLAQCHERGDGLIDLRPDLVRQHPEATRRGEVALTRLERAGAVRRDGIVESTHLVHAVAVRDEGGEHVHRV